MIIQLPGEQEFSQEVAMSDFVPKDELLERDAPIGIPLLDTFPRQVRKAMWEKINREFAGAAVIRAQVRRNQELLSLGPKEEGGIAEDFKSNCSSKGASDEGEEFGIAVNRSVGGKPKC